jgi:hypothetical protein
MATFADLSAENPNIRQQYDEWRELRSQNGEDPTDYQAFRQHVINLGAPDPGEQEIDDLSARTSRLPPERYGQRLDGPEPDDGQAWFALPTALSAKCPYRIPVLALDYRRARSGRACAGARRPA